MSPVNILATRGISRTVKFNYCDSIDGIVCRAVESPNWIYVHTKSECTRLHLPSPTQPLSPSARREVSPRETGTSRRQKISSLPFRHGPSFMKVETPGELGSVLVS